MFKDDKRCPICGSKTEEGFILDFTHGAQTATRWVKGKPKKTIMGVAAFSDRQNYHLSAYRCETCGHLEFYAIGPPFCKSF